MRITLNVNASSATLMAALREAQRHLAALERKSIIPPVERPLPRRRRDGLDRKNQKGEV